MKKIYSIHLEKMGDDFYFIQHLLMQMNENLSVGNLFLACVRSDKYWMVQKQQKQDQGNKITPKCYLLEWNYFSQNKITRICHQKLNLISEIPKHNIFLQWMRQITSFCINFCKLLRGFRWWNIPRILKRIAIICHHRLGALHDCWEIKRKATIHVHNSR